MMFPHHLTVNPFGPHAPRPTPPAETPDIPLAQFSAAKLAGATCLSADGRTAYRLRMGVIEETYWNEEAGEFGRSWWAVSGEDFPDNAVKM